MIKISSSTIFQSIGETSKSGTRLNFNDDFLQRSLLFIKANSGKANISINLLINVETEDDGGPDGEDHDDADGDLLGIGSAHALPAALEHFPVGQSGPRPADVPAAHLDGDDLVMLRDWVRMPLVSATRSVLEHARVDDGASARPLVTR